MGAGPVGVHVTVRDGPRLPVPDASPRQVEDHPVGAGRTMARTHLPSIVSSWAISSLAVTDVDSASLLTPGSAPVASTVVAISSAPRSWLIMVSRNACCAAGPAARSNA